ncbi:MAG: type II toxin-antitoxin system VapB family antitoxin [Solirubrobacterales bacterium]|nr:type II toxin-antitoxin system VapB family antitoxin [Solirubrobacterales bacterium]
MAFNIKDEETDRVVRELALATGESLTDAVGNAAREKLRRVRSRGDRADAMEEIHRIIDRVSRLPVLDDRSPDEIIGYDEHGLPS